jgi:ankyrin repeat protein
MEPTAAERTLIESGHDPRYLDASARHWFLEACRKGPLELVEAFLVCGMPMLVASEQTPPIIKAAESGDIAHVRLLLAHGASLDTVDRSGDTALHTAANHGHAALVRALHALGSTTDTLNHKQWTPLTWALNKKNTAIVETLLACGARPDFGGRNPPIVFAAQELPLLRALLEAGADANRPCGPLEESLLFIHARADRTTLVGALLEHGARDVPNRAGWTAWMIANDEGDPRPALAALLTKHRVTGMTKPDTRLHRACTDGHVDRARALVQEGAALDAVDPSGRTPLMAACATKHRKPELVRWLLEAGADPTIPSVTGESAITHLAAADEIDLLRLLLAKGAPANEGALGDATTPPRSLALIWAANAGRLEAVRALVEAGARLDSRDDFEQTAVFLAASKGHAEVLAALLALGADPSLGGRADTSPLMIAVQNARAACVRILVKAGAGLEQLDAFQKTPLIFACDQSRSTNAAFGEIVTVLLEGGADATRGNAWNATAQMLSRTSGNQPAMDAMEAFMVTQFLARHRRGEATDWAAAAAAAGIENVRALVQRGDVQSLVALFDHGLDVALCTAGPAPVIFDAMRLASPEIATLLLDRGADPRCERTNQNVLLAACSGGHTEIVKRLLALGLDPNLVLGQYRDCALMRAARMARPETVAALLAGGANPNPFRGGITPLISAALASDAASARLLLAAGADPDVLDSRGQPALEVAREKKAKDVVALLGKVTKKDVRDANGRTSLFRACMKGDLPIIELLLEAGADPTVRDKRKETPQTVGALRKDVAARLGVPHTPLTVRPLGWASDPFVDLRRRAGAPFELGGRNGRGDTALHEAILLGDAALVSSLLDQGLDVHAKNDVGDSPWSVAMFVAKDIEPLLRARGAKIDIDAQLGTGSRREAFATAMNAGDLREVQRQLDEKLVHPHLTSPHQSPLLSAVWLADEPLTKLLLEKGCDPHVRLSGPALVVQAAARGNANILRALLDAGLKVEPDALQLAAFYGHRAVMNLLLDEGALPVVDFDSIADLDRVRTVMDVARARGLTALADAAAACLEARVVDESPPRG